MALEIHPDPLMAGHYVSDERLYLDKDGKVVKEGHPDANTLLVGEGGTISQEDAETYGLKVSKAKAKAEVEPETGRVSAEEKAPAKAAAKPPYAKPVARPAAKK